MRLILILILIVGLIVLAKWLWSLVRERAESDAIRANPPQNVCMAVSLPREAEETELKMVRMYERLGSALPRDPELMKKNGDVIYFGYVATGTDGGSMANIRFMIWSPPDLVERVQSIINECYDGEAMIKELSPQDDPMMAYVIDHKQREAIEAAQAAEEKQKHLEET